MGLLIYMGRWRHFRSIHTSYQSHVTIASSVLRICAKMAWWWHKSWVYVLINIYLKQVIWLARTLNWSTPAKIGVEIEVLQDQKSSTVATTCFSVHHWMQYEFVLRIRNFDNFRMYLQSIKARVGNWRWNVESATFCRVKPWQASEIFLLLGRRLQGKKSRLWPHCRTLQLLSKSGTSSPKPGVYLFRRQKGSSNTDCRVGDGVRSKPNKSQPPVTHSYRERPWALRMCSLRVQFGPTFKRHVRSVLWN